MVEIIRIQPITEVLGERDYISGMINLRGSIIPVLHLRKRYDMPIVSFNKKTRIIIVHNENEEIGLIVDEVLMVTHIEEEQLEPPLTCLIRSKQIVLKDLRKVKEQLIGILNLEKVLYPDQEKEG